MRFFADHFRFVRYDERGCGMSDWDDGDLSLDSLGRGSRERCIDAAAVPAAGRRCSASRRARPPASRYAVRHPERVSHLILYGGYARGADARGDPGDARRTAR